MLETPNELQWPVRSTAGLIGSGDVHVWAAGLTLSPARHERLANVLSDDERARATRFRQRDNELRWIASRGQLREILGEYLGIEPACVQLTEGVKGKPFVPQTRLHFNLSHSADLALYAISPDCDVGVDVERVVEAADLPALAEQFFSPAERAALAAIAAANYTSAFYSCWTRKEAYLKASGVGLSEPLDRFDVAVATEHEGNALLRVHDDPDAAASWLVRHLAPCAGFVGALALQLPGARLDFWSWGR